MNITCGDSPVFVQLHYTAFSVAPACSLLKNQSITCIHLLSTHADRHAVDISFTVFCVCVCVCVRRIFGNGYFGRGLM